MKIQENNTFHLSFRMKSMSFWGKNPALLLAITVLIGGSSSLFLSTLEAFFYIIIWISYLIFLKKIAPILLLIGAFFYAHFLYPPPSCGENLSGYFSTTTLSYYQSPFQKSLHYKGMLYIDNKRVPCSIYYRGENHPKADKDYIVYGKLEKRSPYNYLFRASKWVGVKKSWSMAEFRFKLKNNFKKFLSRQLQNNKTSIFLSSLITGELEDRMLRFEFGKLGLQHILAISGFHFAILILFFSHFLQMFLKRDLKIIALLILINAYFLFVGSLPAVQRSWLTASLFLVGKLIKRHSSPLNLLGVAMLVELILDPLIATNLGFQLSFTSCAGILLFSTLIPISSVKTQDLSLGSKHISLLSHFFKNGLKISLAVNLAILPLLLFHFHQFPLMSFIYNLFIPFLVSIAIFSLLIALTINIFFTLFSPPFFHFTDWITKQILDLVQSPPIALDYSLLFFKFPSWIIPAYLFTTLCISIHYKESAKPKWKLS